MLKKTEYLCVVGSIALIGADRIDLSAGYGPFRLTPFLFFASLALFIHLLLLGFRGKLRVAITLPVRRQIPFLILLALFLFLSFASTILGLDPQRGLVALCGLVLVAMLGYWISVRIFSDSTPEKLVVRSVTFGLILYLIFCIGGVIAWSHEPSVCKEKRAHPSNPHLRPLQHFSGRLGFQAGVLMQTALASSW